MLAIGILNGWLIAGIIILILLIALFVWAFPELHRYLHVRRM